MVLTPRFLRSHGEGPEGLEGEMPFTGRRNQPGGLNRKRPGFRLHTRRRACPVLDWVLVLVPGLAAVAVPSEEPQVS